MLAVLGAAFLLLVTVLAGLFAAMDRDAVPSPPPTPLARVTPVPWQPPVAEPVADQPTAAESGDLTEEIAAGMAEAVEETPLPEQAVAAPIPTPAPAAEPPLPPGSTPKIAIVIDDMGLNWKNSARATALPAPVTLSYLPYAENLQAQADAALAAGHELFLHMPMQPVGGEYPGPDALVAGLSDDEVRTRMLEALQSFSGYTGLNNHMGSRATADRHVMETIMPLLKERDLIFLDSRTSEQSVAYEVARADGVQALKRDVFLDHTIDGDSIRKQLALTERIARRQGFAIAIGHPHGVTLDVLERWLPDAIARGYKLVALDELLH